MLFAKADPSITLLRHSEDVVSAATALFGDAEPSRLGQSWLRFFRVHPDSYRQFRAELLAAAWLHDIGKANDGFVAMVKRLRDQSLRHEHLSALLIASPEIDGWLRATPLPIDWDVVLAVVLSHHLKAPVEDFVKTPALAAHRWVRVLSDDLEFAGLLAGVAGALNIRREVPQVLTNWHFGPRGDVDIHELATAARCRLRGFDEELDDDRKRRRRLWAVRAALIAADAVGSAMERTREDISAWIASVFQREQLNDSDVWSKVIRPRLASLRVQGKWKDDQGHGGWSTFQEHAADPAHVPARALMLAPCGSGKTLAAWRWIAARLQERPASRVVFLYPTRATATEGFRDYVSWAPESDAALMHATAAYELSALSFNPDDGRHSRDYRVDPRLFAIGHWGKRIFSATVDQFLAFLQYSYRAVCMLPALADSVMVVDEVHSFDPGMFSALCEFLAEFEVPVLCMTATLPQNRIDSLKRSGLEVYNEKPDDLRVVAERPRYRVGKVDRESAENRVRETLEAGRRVLWVVNTVARAQKIAGIAGWPAPVLCYHSRFRLKDRRMRHDAAVAAVRPDQPASLTVTTQVCEMSLDLDADMLVTEVAPVTSLIQRMGRCNRHRDGRPDAGEVLIYRSESEKPYKPDDLRGIDEFLRSLADRPIGQSDLEAALDGLPLKVELPKACQFTASGPWADSREETLRDIDEFTVPAVLDGDIEAYMTAGPERAGWVVPVPWKALRGNTRPGVPSGWPRWLHVAPSKLYDERLGFREPGAETGGA